MFDRWIAWLNSLFILSIFFWAFAAWRELWIYRRIKDTFALITSLCCAQDTFDHKGIPDCIVVRGVYKNRALACRLSHIRPTWLFFYRVDIHCHIEPKDASKNPVSYKATALSKTMRCPLTEGASREEILEVFEEVTGAAETAESKN
jgi:hypothetical protein